MKKILFCFCFLFSCSSGHNIMTVDTFSEIHEGMTKEEVRKVAGRPYSIKNIGKGEYEYVYIERVISGNRVIEERRYFILIKKGIVTSKKMNIEKDFEPLYERNSYELQTS